MTSQSTPTQVIAGRTVLSTPIINKALELAQKHHDRVAYNHIARSWLYASLIISKLPEAQRDTIDLEAIGVATILHDLGWSTDPTVRSQDKIFEVDGANAARAFILREGGETQWDQHRIQLVWDSIALHTCPEIAAHKQPEVLFTMAGIVIELFGAAFGKLKFGDSFKVEQEELDQIAVEFPRAGMRGCVKDIMCGFCREKPEATYGTWVGAFGDRFVEGYSSEGKLAIDLLMGKLEE